MNARIMYRFVIDVITVTALCLMLREIATIRVSLTDYFQTESETPSLMDENADKK